MYALLRGDAQKRVTEQIGKFRFPGARLCDDDGNLRENQRKEAKEGDREGRS